MELEEVGDLSGLAYPNWQKPLHAALLATQQERLQKRVAEAEAAIFQRLQQLSDCADSAGERQALAEGSRSLSVLKKERLKYSDL